MQIRLLIIFPVCFHELGDCFTGIYGDGVIKRNAAASYETVAIDADKMVFFCFSMKSFS